MTTDTKPREDKQGRRLLDILKQTGMFKYPDACTLPAVANYILQPGQTKEEAYQVVVDAILNRDLHHVMVGSTMPRSELPVTRWAWVEDWLNECEIVE